MVIRFVQATKRYTPKLTSLPASLNHTSVVCVVAASKQDIR